MDNGYHIGYESLTELLRTLPLSVRKVFLSEENQIVQDTEIQFRFVRRIKIQVIEQIGRVRYLFVNIGNTIRTLGENNKIFRNPQTEDLLAAQTKSALLGIESWLVNNNFEVERAAIAIPSGLIFEFGSLPDFLVFDLATQLFIVVDLKPENLTVQ